MWFIVWVLVSVFIGEIIAELVIMRLKRKQERKHRAIFVARLSRDLTGMRLKVYTFSLNGQHFQILANSVDDAWVQARRVADGCVLIKTN